MERPHSFASRSRTQLERDGVTFSYTYDALNRVTSDGTTSYTYDNVGRIKAAGNVAFTYDALGRQTAETNATGTVVSSAYDAAGNRIKLTWSDTNYVTYTRDPLGRVTPDRRERGGFGRGRAGLLHL